MSLYAEYITERTSDKIIELEHGFLTYRHLPDQKATYIIDLYVRPAFRKEGLASYMADQVANEARSLGYTKLLGTVVPRANGADTSLKVLQAYGMKLKDITDSLIVMEKDI